jgi:hypothetical protein
LGFQDDALPLQCGKQVGCVFTANFKRAFARPGSRVIEPRKKPNGVTNCGRILREQRDERPRSSVGSRIRIEDAHEEPRRFDLHPEFEFLRDRRERLGEPSLYARRDDARTTGNDRRGRRRPRKSGGAGRATTGATAEAFPPFVKAIVDERAKRRRCRPIGVCAGPRKRREGRTPPKTTRFCRSFCRFRLLGPILITQRHEQRADVFAVAAELPKDWARALGTEPGRRDLKLDTVGLWITPPYESSGGKFAEDDIGDRAAPDVVGSAQERARPEETPQCAIGEGRKRFEEGGRGHCSMHAFPRVLGGTASTAVKAAFGTQRTA